MEKKFRFDLFVKKIYLNVPLEKVYWCWATEEGITSWFLRAADFHREEKRIKPREFLKAGDRYLWMWHNWDGEEEGEVTYANGKDKIAYTFAGSCGLTISLQPLRSGTLLVLTQDQIPTDDDSKIKIYCGCGAGWTFWLTNLKAYLEHGILLNETFLDLSNDPMAAYEFVNI